MPAASLSSSYSYYDDSVTSRGGVSLSNSNDEDACEPGLRNNRSGVENDPLFQLKKKDALITQLNATVEEYATECVRLKLELEKKLRVAATASHDSSCANMSLERQHHQQQSAIVELEARVRQLTDEKNKLEVELSVSQQQWELAQAEAKSKGELLANAEKNVTLLTQLLDDSKKDSARNEEIFTSHIATLEKQLKKKEKDYQKLEGQHAKDMMELNAQFAELQQEFEAVKKGHARQTDDADALQQHRLEIAALKEKEVRLRQEFFEKQNRWTSELRQQQRIVASLEQSLTTLQNNNSMQSSIYPADTTDAVDVLERENDTLRRVNHAKERSISEMRAQLAGLTTTVSELSLENDTLRNRAQALEKQLASQKTEATHLGDTLKSDYETLIRTLEEKQRIYEAETRSKLDQMEREVAEARLGHQTEDRMERESTARVVSALRETIDELKAALAEKDREMMSLTQAGETAQQRWHMQHEAELAAEQRSMWEEAQAFVREKCESSREHYESLLAPLRDDLEKTKAVVSTLQGEKSELLHGLEREKARYRESLENVLQLTQQNQELEEEAQRYNRAAKSAKIRLNVLEEERKRADGVARNLVSLLLPTTQDPKSEETEEKSSSLIQSLNSVVEAVNSQLEENVTLRAELAAKKNSIKTLAAEKEKAVEALEEAQSMHAEEVEKLLKKAHKSEMQRTKELEKLARLKDDALAAEASVKERLNSLVKDFVVPGIVDAVASFPSEAFRLLNAYTEPLTSTIKAMEDERERLLNQRSHPHPCGDETLPDDLLREADEISRTILGFSDGWNDLSKLVQQSSQNSTLAVTGAAVQYTNTSRPDVALRQFNWSTGELEELRDVSVELLMSHCESRRPARYLSFGGGLCNTRYHNKDSGDLAMLRDTLLISMLQPLTEMLS